MPEQYRIHFLDTADNGANDAPAVLPFEAGSDAAAYAAAKSHAGARPFELWNGDRLVIRRVSAKGDAP